MTGYAALDRTLRGSPLWPAISCFDRPRLIRIAGGRERDPGGVRPLIEGFIEQRETPKLVVID